MTSTTKIESSDSPGCLKKCNVTCWAKSLLISLNVTLLIIGLIISCLGLVLVTGNTIVSGYMESLFRAVPGASGSSLGGFFLYVAAVIVTLGIIVMCMGILGCCGARSRNPRLLYVYTGILIFLLLVEITTTIVCATMNSWIDTKLSDGLLQTIKDHYAGGGTADSISNAWNYAFVTYKCCGNIDYNDLHLAVNWNRTGTSIVIPDTCCKLTSSDYPKHGNPVDATCTTVPSTANSYYKTGCFDEIKNRVTQYMGYIIGFAVVILIIQITLIVSAFLVSRKRKKTGPE